MTLVLDAGAFLAVERNQRTVLLRLAAAQRNGIGLRTSAIVIGQVWRSGSGRPASLARLLMATDVVPVDQELGRAAGHLVGRAGAADPIDATVVLIAGPRDTILTSDPNDIGRLLAAADSSASVLTC